MNKLNRTAFLMALGLAILMLIPYEWYFRKVEQWPRGHDLENLDVWADQRSRVDQLTEKDVIILGSSRAHFDINIHLWDSITGVRPLQLAYPGSSPFIPVRDIVENTSFNGLLIIGVSPGLFFTTEDSWGANRGKTFVDHYHKRTYAQKFNQKIYDFIDPQFSYLQGDLTLENLIERLPIPNRDSVRHPDIWPPMVHMDKYRNIRMLPIMENDTTIQNRQKDIWFNPNPKNRVEEHLDEVMDHYAGLVKKFKERGGKVVFIRPPVTGYYLETEAKLFPREKYWDRLLQVSDCPGYHYADHPVTADMIPPEWSHLTRKDSDTYTKIIISLLQSDKLL